MVIGKAKIDEKDFEKIVLELAGKGLTNEKIGLVLKKEYNIPKAKKTFGKRISQLLKGNNINTDPDIENLKKSVENLKMQIEKNKQDMSPKRALMKKAAKLRKLQSRQ